MQPCGWFCSDWSETLVLLSHLLASVLYVSVSEFTCCQRSLQVTQVSETVLYNGTVMSV
jgi:hypothetical protein